MRKTLFSLLIVGLVLVALVVVNGAVLLSDGQLEARAHALLDRVLQVPFSLEQVSAERRGLVVRGLSIGGGAEPVITVEEAVLELSGVELGLGAIHLTRPVIRIHRDAAGEVNLFGLLDPEFTESAGETADLPSVGIVCEGARVVFRDERLYGPGEGLTVSGLNADVSIEENQLFARAHFQPRWAKGASLVVRAYLGGDGRAPTFDADIGANKVLVNRELRPLLPLRNRRLFDTLRPHGIADVSVRIASGRDGGETQVNGEVLILNGGISFVRFPYPIENATGRVEISESQIRLRDIQGAREHGRFSCEGDIQVSGPGEDDYLDLRIEAKQIRLDEALAQSLPAEVETIYRRFSPTGRASASVWIHGFSKPPGIPDDVHVDIDGSVEGVTARLDVFPVPVSDVAGRFQVHDASVTIQRARGSVGGGTVDVSGTATEESVHIVVEATGVETTEEIVDNLPEPANAIVRSLSPGGAVDATATITHAPEGAEDDSEAPDTGSKDLRLSVRVEPHPGFAVSYEQFPYPLTLQRGAVVVDGRGRVRLDGLEAAGPGAEGVRIQASLAQEAQEAPTSGAASAPAHLRVTAEQVVVDKALRSALARITGSTGPEPTWLTPLGLVDGQGTVRDLEVDLNLESGLAGEAPAQPAGGLSDVAVKFGFEGFVLRPGGIETPVTEASGRVTLDRGRLELREMTGRLLGGDVALSGDLTLDPASESAEGGNDLDAGQPLTLDAHDVPIDRRLREALADLSPRGKALADTFNRFGIEDLGVLDHVRVVLAGPSGGAVAASEGESWPDPRVESRFHGAAVRAEAFPYRVTQVEGALRFADGLLELLSVNGKAGTGRVTARGRFHVESPSAEKGDAVRLELTDVPVDAALREALPPKIAGAFDSVAPSFFDVRFDGFRIRVEQRLPKLTGVGYLSPTDVVDGGGMLWNTETVIRIPRLQVGIPLDDVVVQAQLSGVLPNDEEVLAAWPVLARGFFTVPQASWNKQPIRDLTANVEVRNDRFLVTDLDASFLGGAVTAAKTFYRFDGLRAGGRFALENGRVEAWLGLNDNRADNDRWFGRIEGFLEFDGVPGSPNPELRIGGKGKVRVRDGRFLKIPVLAASLDRADVDISLKGGATEGASGRVLLDDILVSNPAFTVRGSGEIAADAIHAKLSVRILRETTDDSLFVQLLRSPLWLLGQIFGAIIDVEVQGPLTAPDVKARVLPIFQDMVE